MLSSLKSIDLIRIRGYNGFMESIVCKNCGKMFRVDPYRVTTARFCSVHCSNEFKSVLLNCEFCRNNFRRPRSNIKQSSRHQFCSSNCFHSWTKVSIEHRKKMARESVKQYRHKHPGWTRNLKAKRRALEKELGGSFSNYEWENLKVRYGFRCLRCEKSEPDISLTVDHIVSLARWQEWAKGQVGLRYQWNDIENIQPLCKSCNSIKNKNIQNFREKI